LPTFSREDAENLVRRAAEAYRLEQNPENREALRKAVWSLQETDAPLSEWRGASPSHRFMLSLLPEELRWPDPLWGETLFH
jgi:hypothetical protein